MTPDRLRTLAPALCAVLLTACAVGPDYQSPQLHAGADWVEPAALFDQSNMPPENWWEGFKDAQLDALVQRSLQHNPGLAGARARVREARAARRAAGGALLPGVGANLAATRSSPSLQGNGAASELAAAGLIGRISDDFQSGLEVAWELDLFGRLRREREGAQARLEASEAQLAAARLMVAAEVSSSYLMLRGAQARLAVLQRNVTLQAETVQLTGRKLAGGLVPELDLLRARAQLESTRAQVPSLEAQVAAGIYALSVLAGDDPGAHLAALSNASRLPEPPARVAVGQRAALLLRRPDVMAAERTLAAATAGIGSAQAERWPRVDLLALGGFNAGEFPRLFEDDSVQWLLNPAISLPVFQGGRVAAGVEVARARVEQAMASWREAVLGSLQEAETGMTLYERERETLARLSRAQAASAEAASIAERLYDSGLGDFLSVLDAQRRLIEVQDAHIQSQTRLVLRLVDLYRALGGGANAAPTQVTVSGPAR